MDYAELFGWWISSITFNILFVISAAVYLYIRRKARGKEAFTWIGRVVRIIKEFVFVWILLGLLMFYVYSVGGGSYALFAAGNIAVEVFLCVYVLKASKHSQTQQT